MGHTDNNRYQIRHINAAHPDVEELSIRHHNGIKNEDVEVLVLEPGLSRLREAALLGDDEFRHVFDEVIDSSFPRTNLDIMRKMFLPPPSVRPPKSSTWLANIKQTLAGILKAAR